MNDIDDIIAKNKLRILDEIYIKTKTIDTLLSLESERRDRQAIEPFFQVRKLSLTFFRGDLTFLRLFPGLESLQVTCVFTFDLSLQGIQNCPMLRSLSLLCPRRPIQMNGIEFCEQLEQISINSGGTYEGEPLNIDSLSCLPRLKILDTGWIPVRTEGLDLSGCRLLEKLSIRPTSKRVDFLGNLRLVKLRMSGSNLRTLKGLDTTRLIKLEVDNNNLRSINTLRNAPCMEFLDIRDNLFRDMDHVKRIVNTLPHGCGIRR